MFMFKCALYHSVVTLLESALYSIHCTILIFNYATPVQSCISAIDQDCVFVSKKAMYSVSYCVPHKPLQDVSLPFWCLIRFFEELHCDIHSILVTVTSNEYSAVHAVNINKSDVRIKFLASHFTWLYSAL